MEHKPISVAIPHYIKGIQKGRVLLPDFQRNYVWPEEKICDLFDSILNDYPIGSLIVWKPSRKEVQDNSSEFIPFANKVKLRKGDKNINIITNYVTIQNGDKEVILDGQQRLTSLYLTLTENTIVERSKGGSLKLCYNLELPKQTTHGRFSFILESEVDAKSHYKMEDLYKFSQSKFEKSLCSLKMETDKKNLRDLREKLSEKSFDLNKQPYNKEILSVFEISHCTYEEALDVFVNVNSTGTQLSKTDLLLSKLTSKSLVNVEKKEINNYVTSLNDNGRFGFSVDNVLHTAIVLTAKMKENRSLTVKNMGTAADDIDKNWNNIKKALDKTKSMLKSKGFYNICLSSYNALIPIAYYYYNDGRGDTTDEEAMKQYLMRCSLKHIYKSHTDGVINDCIDSIDKMLKQNDKRFDIKQMISDIPQMKVNKKEDIDAWLKEEKGEQTKNILCFLQLNSNPYNNDYHQDHLHPFSRFKKNQLKRYKKNNAFNTSVPMDVKTQKRWIKMGNTLPNLDMLQSTPNEKKRDKALKTWMSESGHLFKFDPGCGYEFEKFEIFYSERKKLLENQLVELFKVENALI